MVDKGTPCLYRQPVYIEAVGQPPALANGRSRRAPHPNKTATMKTLVICLALVAISSAAYVRPDHLGNSIDDLVRNALEYVRQQMKEHEPLKVPEIPQQVINDDEAKIYLTVDLTDVYVSKASDFTVDNIENNMIDFWAKFALTIPTAHVDGKFTVSGTAMGHKVDGSGTFSADVTGLKVSGFIQNELLDGKYLHIQDMTVDYDIQDLKFKEQGLVVEGMTKEELEKIFDTELLKFLQKDKDVVCKKVAAFIKDEANEMIKGKTLEEVIDWLRHLIDPTAAPQLA